MSFSVKTKRQLLNFTYHLLVALIIVFGGLMVRWKIRPLFPREEEQFMVIFIEYLIYYGALRTFVQAFKKWKHFNVLYKVVSFPEHCYPLFIKPYLKMFIGSIFFLCIFALIHIFLQHFPENIGYDWTYSTKAFIGISLSAILMRAFGNTIIKLTFRLNYKSDNRREHVDLTLSLINEQRIRYLIYLFFFILLVWYTLIDLENPHILSHANESKAVLSAFGVFIAFDRLIDKRTLIGFNTKEHARHLLAVYDKDPKYEGKENYLADFLRKLTRKNQTQ